MENINPPQEAPAFWSWFNYFAGSIKSAAFRSGLELAVWGKISHGLDTAQAIAESEGWDENGVRRLLDMLASMGLVTAQGGIYRLVPEAEWYLVPGKTTYMGNFLLYLMDWEGKGQLTSTICSGKRPISKEIVQAELDAIFAEFFSYHRASPVKSADQSASQWQVLGITARDGLGVLDFACGSAISTLALCRLHQGVRATLQDRPRVLEVALEIARSLGVAAQIELLPGDMRTVDFGENRFDVARVRNALFYLGPAEIIHILSRVRKSLKPGGIFIIEDTIADDQIVQDSYPPIDALMLYALTEQGDTYTFAEWESFIGRAEFINIKREGSLIRAEVSDQ